MGEPGKFEGGADEGVGKRLYEFTLNGFQNDELGEADGFGWYALLIDTGIPQAPHVIVWEDNNGFFDYVSYDTEEEAREIWGKLEAEYKEYCEEQEGEID